MDDDLGPAFESLKETLDNEVNIEARTTKTPLSDAEWEIICRVGQNVLYVENAGGSSVPRARFAVYEGFVDEKGAFERGQYLDVFTSVEEVAEFINEYQSG